MARPKKKSGGKPERSPEDALVEATLSLVAARGWRRLALEDVIEAAGVDTAEAAGLAGRKTDLLRLVVHSVDRAMIAEATPEPDETARERLFEVLMARFDALQARRETLGALVRESMRDPLLAAHLAQPLEDSMRWALRTAGVGTAGVRGLARARILALLYLAVVRVWLRDESPDMAQTMKALDQRLAQAEELANTFDRGGLRRRRTGEGAPPEEPAEDAPEAPPPA